MAIDFKDKDKNLGREGKDKVTGFKGIITGRISFLTGCDQYGIVPKVKKDGKVEETQWFDIKRIDIIGKGIHPKEVKEKRNPGGSNRDCPGRSH